jgi:hypothetical protein
MTMFDYTNLYMNKHNIGIFSNRTMDFFSALTCNISVHIFALFDVCDMNHTNV